MINFNKLTEIAASLFDKTEHGLRTFHVSFIIYKQKLLITGINSASTHPINLRNPKYADGINVSSSKGTCSELKSLLRLKRLTNINPAKCIMVVIRINRNGQLANSCPCMSCKSLLAYVGLKKVYHSTDENDFVEYNS